MIQKSKGPGKTRALKIRLIAGALARLNNPAIKPSTNLNIAIIAAMQELRADRGAHDRAR